MRAEYPYSCQAVQRSLASKHEHLTQRGMAPPGLARRHGRRSLRCQEQAGTQADVV